GRIAYNNHGDIYLSNPQETKVQRIGDGGDTSAGPSLSKDGRWLAWAEEGLPVRSTIRILKLPKSGLLPSHIHPKNVTKHAVATKLNAAYSPAWSPNGKSLTFVCEDTSGYFDICTISRSGKHLKRLTHFHCANPGRNARP